MTSLHFILFISNHIVTKIVKAHLVVSTISNIGVISLSSFCVCLVVNNKTYVKTEETVKLSHPFRVTFCKVVVNGYDMNAVTCKRIKVSGKGGNKSFTFTCLHFGNSSLMKYNAADNLNLEMLHTKNTPCAFTTYCKSVGQDVVKCFSVCESFLK